MIYCILLIVLYFVLNSSLYHFCFLPNTHLTYSSVFLLAVTGRPVSGQLHGQAEIDDDTRAVSLDEDIAAVQVPVGHRGLVQVWMEEGGEGEKRMTNRGSG